MSKPGRYLPLHVQDWQSMSAAANMATDQLLLEAAAATQQPALRLYRWKEPILSLGYFQKYEDRAGHADSRSIQCVRRATGGGAIVHDHELTYSLSVPAENAAIGAREDLYRLVHGAITDVLSEWGVRAAPYHQQRHRQAKFEDRHFLCFQRRTPEDLVVCGYKVVGSAQRKIRGALLQHGSLLLRASAAAPQLPGIDDLTIRIDMQAFADRLAQKLAHVFSVQWIAQALTPEEIARADQICAATFANDSWTHRR